MAPGDITISCLASVPPHFAPRVVNVIQRMAKSRGLFAYVTENVREGTTRVELTAHERVAPIEITDAATLEILKFVADSQGKTIVQLLRDAARDTK